MKLNLPQRGRGKGAGRGCPFPNWFRRMAQKLVAIGVPASSATEAIATIVEAIIPEEVIEEHGGMELPDWSFMKQQRTEVAALHHICAGMAFARSTRVVDFETDESPLNQQSFGVMPMRLEEMVDGEPGNPNVVRRRHVPARGPDCEGGGRGDEQQVPRAA